MSMLETGIETNIVIDKYSIYSATEAAMSNVLQKTEINGKEEIWIILWFLKVQCCSFGEDITKYSPISIQCCCMVRCCRSGQKKRAFRVRA